MPTEQSPTIIVVEDDKPTLLYLMNLLRTEGFNAVPSENGANALKLLGTMPVDLVLSDIMMPMIDGVALYEKAQQDPKLRSIPFIFLTASTDQKVHLKGVELGVDAYLTKPLDRELLLASIRGKLRRSSGLRSSQTQEMDAMKRELLTALTNEVRVPAKIVKNLTSMLLDERVRLSQTQMSDLLKSIQAGGDRLNRALDDFELAFKLESGAIRQEFELDKNRYDVWGILNTVQTDLAAYIGAKKIHFNPTAPSEKPVVFVSRNLVMKLLDRLLYGAVAFSRPSGKIEVSGEVAEDIAKLFVRMPGTALNKSDEAHVFDKFHAFRTPTTDEYPIGLSLFNAKLLAQANRGDLTCTTDPAIGTTFVLTLPRL